MEKVNYEIKSKSFYLKINEVDVNCWTHMHEEIEIMYVREGLQGYTVDGKKHILQPGEAVMVFPNIVHSLFRGAKPTPSDVVLIICSAKFYGGFLHGLEGVVPEDPILTRDQISEDARYAFNAIDKTADENERMAWGVIILSNLIKSLRLEKKRSFPVEEMSYKIVKYIEENFTKPITIDTIAEEFSLSSGYVSQLFSERIKVNFRKYLGMVRAEYAANLIRTTSDSLTIISENAGFESQRTFNRIFKDIYGMAPSEFRNSVKRYSQA